MQSVVRRAVLSTGVALPAVTVASRVQATPSIGELDLPNGAPVRLEGTPHLFLLNDGQLHWIGDTRALAGLAVQWNAEETLPYSTLGPAVSWNWIGDPYLSTGLLKDGDPIYLVKWEQHWEQPKLLHIQSIKDVELFGINARNYGDFVLDKSAWEAKYGMAADTLERQPLQAATWGRWKARRHDNWPSITLYSRLLGGGQVLDSEALLRFSCQRGSGRRRAWISVPYANVGSWRQVTVAHYPHLAYLPPAQFTTAGPRITKDGRVLDAPLNAEAASWQYRGDGAWWEDNTDHPYARRLWDAAHQAERQAEQFTVEVPYLDGRRRYSWWLAGIETATAWLEAECAKPAV